MRILYRPLLALLLILTGAAVAADTVRQPVFLICPKEHGMSAWSAYLVCDKTDPSKVVSLGLEMLKRKNAQDMDIKDVYKAQSDADTTREQIGSIDEKDFNSGSIVVKKNEALVLSVTPLDNGEYRLNIDLRIAADKRYVIGGKEKDKREVIVRFDRKAAKWNTFAKTMIVDGVPDSNGKNVGSDTDPIWGILFPVVQTTGIYKILMIFDGGGAVKIMEREDKKPED